MSEGKKPTERQRRWIIVKLACFDGPTEVATAFLAEFGKPISKQAVSLYDYSVTKPENRSKAKPELLKLFDESREFFTKHYERIPIANKAYRLKLLQQMVEGVLSNPRGVNHKELRAILEQAAKEAGGAFTNRHELSGPGGGPIRVGPGYDFSALTDEELDEFARLADKATPVAPPD